MSERIDKFISSVKTQPQYIPPKQQIKQRIEDKGDFFYLNLLDKYPDMKELFCYAHQEEVRITSTILPTLLTKAPGLAKATLEEMIVWADKNPGTFQQAKEITIAPAKEEPNGRLWESQNLTPNNNLLLTPNNINTSESTVCEGKKETIMEVRTTDNYEGKNQPRGRPITGGIYREIGHHKDLISPDIRSLARGAYIQLIKDGKALANWSRIKIRKQRCSCKRCKADKNFSHGLRAVLLYKSKATGTRTEKHLRRV